MNSRTLLLALLGATLTVGLSLPLVAQDGPTASPTVKEKVVAKDAARPLPTAKEVTNKLDDLFRAKTSQGRITMTIVNNRGTRKLTMEQWSRGQDDALFVIRAPAREKGTATLKTKEGLWNYAPRADRLIRVPAGLLADAWMGSHLTNDDLVQESSLEDDYTTKMSWRTEGGTLYLVATMTPRPNAPVVYTKLDYVLDADTWIPVRADYFDRGKLMRKMTFSEVKKIGERSMPMVMTMTPTDKPNEYTELRYDKMKFDIPIKKDMFTKKGLRRVAKR